MSFLFARQLCNSNIPLPAVLHSRLVRPYDMSPVVRIFEMLVLLSPCKPLCLLRSSGKWFASYNALSVAQSDHGTAHCLLGYPKIKRFRELGIRHPSSIVVGFEEFFDATVNGTCHQTRSTGSGIGSCWCPADVLDGRIEMSGKASNAAIRIACIMSQDSNPSLLFAPKVLSLRSGS